MIQPGDIIVAVLALITFCLVAAVICANKAAREEGYSDGYIAGLDVGYKDGYAVGSKDVDAAYRAGVDDGRKRIA